MAKKVLVVDDEKLIVKGIRFSLEQDGMEVDYAYDGESAYRMLKDGAEVTDRKSTRLNSSHMPKSRMPSSA